MPDIQHAIQISASAEAIVPLFATAQGLGAWWATDITEPPGAVELGFFNRATIYHLRPAAQHTPHTTDWICESGDEWSGTHLIFRLEPAKAGTLLRFSHAGWRAATDYFISCNTTWGALMFRLKAAAEGKLPGPLFTREGWVA